MSEPVSQGRALVSWIWGRARIFSALPSRFVLFEFVVDGDVEVEVDVVFGGGGEMREGNENKVVYSVRRRGEDIRWVILSGEGKVVERSMHCWTPRGVSEGSG